MFFSGVMPNCWVYEAQSSISISTARVNTQPARLRPRSPKPAPQQREWKKRVGGASWLHGTKRRVRDSRGSQAGGRTRMRPMQM
jgi:hypothetical protein